MSSNDTNGGPVSLPADAMSLNPNVVVMTDPQGRRWQLGFDETVSPPIAIWLAVPSWAIVKQTFASWRSLKGRMGRWGTVKAL